MLPLAVPSRVGEQVTYCSGAACAVSRHCVPRDVPFPPPRPHSHTPLFPLQVSSIESVPSEHREEALTKLAASKWVLDSRKTLTAPDMSTLRAPGRPDAAAAPLVAAGEGNSDRPSGDAHSSVLVPAPVERRNTSIRAPTDYACVKWQQAGGGSVAGGFGHGAGAASAVYIPAPASGAPSSSRVAMSTTRPRSSVASDSASVSDVDPAGAR